MNTLQAGDAGLFADVRHLNACNQNRGRTTISERLGTHHDSFALTRAPSAHDIASRIESGRPERPRHIPFCHIST